MASYHSSVGLLERLPGTDEFGAFVVERVERTKNGGLYLDVRYDCPEINVTTCWYYSPNGDRCRSNPDGSLTVTHGAPDRNLTRTSSVVTTAAWDPAQSVSASGTRASGVLVLGWPIFMIFTKRLTVTVSVNLILAVALLMGTFFRKLDRTSDSYY